MGIIKVYVDYDYECAEYLHFSKTRKSDIEKVTKLSMKTETL